MNKRYKLLLLLSISIIIIVVIIGVRNIFDKDNDEYSFYYISYTSDDEGIIDYSIYKYNNYNGEVETVFVSNEKIEYIYDVYDDNQMIIGGKFDGFYYAEYNNGKIINLEETFNISKKELDIQYIKSSGDIACKKDNTILIYRKDTQKIDEINYLEDKNGVIDNFSFSYDEKILYYSYCGIVYAYDIETKTDKEIFRGTGVVNVSKNGENILYWKSEEICRYNIATEDTKTIDEADWIVMYIYAPRFNEDGTKVLYAKQKRVKEKVKFYIYDVETGKTKMVHKVENALPYYGW